MSKALFISAYLLVGVGLPIAAFLILPIQHAAEFLLGYGGTFVIRGALDMWRER